MGTPGIGNTLNVLPPVSVFSRARGDGELHQFNPDGTGAISAAHFEFDKFEALFLRNL
jgi:hypothetical protein